MSAIFAGHTVEEAWAVLNETRRITDEATRKQTPRVNARAAATSTPPDASEVFFTYVGETMDKEGCTRAEAIRIVATKHPSLHAAYVAEANKQRRAKAESDRKDAARALARRNRR